MSHVTKITTIRIADVNAIRRAVDELASKGIDITLGENAMARLWGDSRKKAELVLQLNSCRFDVGLEKQSDNTYVPFTDLWDGHVRNQIGIKDEVAARRAYGQAETAEDMTLAIGQFLQQYSRFAAQNLAIAQGYSIEGETEDEKGNIHIHVNVA